MARWYRKAADLNYADAQYNLAIGYAEGEGAAVDHAEAIRWLRKAYHNPDVPTDIRKKALGELNYLGAAP